MTKDTEKAFVIVYSEYLRRRSFGTAKCEAVQFDESKIMAIEGFSKWNPADISYCMRELKNLGYIDRDIIGGVTLNEAGIEFMENKPKEYFSGFTGTVKDLLTLIAAFLPASLT